MGRLTTLKPRLSTLSPRIGRLPNDERERHRERDQNLEHRGWYKTKQWQDLRMEVLVRDSFTCQRTGVLCIGTYPAGNSPVADHIKPHHGDKELFWDKNNIHCVSKAYHDSQKQKEERAQARW